MVKNLNYDNLNILNILSDLIPIESARMFSHVLSNIKINLNAFDWPNIIKTFECEANPNEFRNIPNLMRYKCERHPCEFM